MKIKAFIYFTIAGLFVLLTACDMTNDLKSASNTLKDTSNQQPESQFSSRVFDGRDSLITGENGPTATKDNFAIITQFIEISGGDDVGHIGITDPDNLDPSTLLFESRKGNPILKPNGEQVTWGTFNGIEGVISIKCTRKGTHATVHLAGLLPNGVYSIRNELTDPDTGELLGRIGYTEIDQKGKLNATVTRSSFRASFSGEGHITGFIRSGALEKDLIGNCMLNDARKDGIYDWHTIAIYQIDGTPELNSDGTFVEQAGFLFAKGSLPIDIN